MTALAPPTGRTIETAAALVVDHAGAESNTCVGLARLGLRTAWVSRLGADPAGDRILTALQAEGIETRWVERDLERPTGLMLKQPGAAVRYYRHQSAASIMGPDILRAVPIGRARAVLVTGVTALVGPQPHAAALALLEGGGRLRIVDPNLRDGLWGSDRRVSLVRSLIERCDLLLAGAAELEEILGSGGSDGSGRSGGLDGLARRARALGPSEVVVRGATTVGALAGDAWHAIEIRRGDAVDAVGAGDSFNAGYIGVRLRGGSIDEALRIGVRCGAAVTAAPSDTAGFPRDLRVQD